MAAHSRVDAHLLTEPAHRTVVKDVNWAYGDPSHRTRVVQLNRPDRRYESLEKGRPMPNITVELLKGRTVEQRRDFAKAVADSAVEILGARRQDVRMVFTEITADIVANGGVLASEDESRAGVVAALADD
jgi:4-oxalocrotonate tautomerase